MGGLFILVATPSGGGGNIVFGGSSPIMSHLFFLKGELVVSWRRE